jgi:hypothetical protein
MEQRERGVMHAADYVQTTAFENPIVREAHHLITVSPALRDPSRAGCLRSPCRSPELLTSQMSAISIPKHLLIITDDFAHVDFPSCSFLQMSRGNCGSKIPSRRLTLSAGIQ